MATAPRKPITGTQKVILERAQTLAEEQMAIADQLLGRLGAPPDDDTSLKLHVALMQVLATNYAAEVDKRKD